MGKGSAPKAPDPKETASAQTATNISSAIANSALNNVNQVTPYGSLNYSTTGQQFVSDPNGQQYWVDGSGQYHTSLPTQSLTTPGTASNRVWDSTLGHNGGWVTTGGGKAASTSQQSYTPSGWSSVKGYYIPTTTATQTLSPEQQAIFNQTQAAQLNLGTLANQQSAKLIDYLNTPVDLSTSNVEKYINNHYSDDFNKQQDKQLGSLQSQLSNQGIKLGSDAYTNALSDFNASRNSAYDNMYGDQYNNAVQQLLTQRNQPLNEISSLLSGSQITAPSFVNTPQSNIATVDYAGLVNQDYQNKLAAYQQKQAQTQGILGGLFGLGGKIIAASDRRLKTDIKKVGELDGHKLYSFKYKKGKGDGKHHVGVMAQEVEKTRPDAVSRRPDGMREVNYGKLFKAGVD